MAVKTVFKQGRTEVDGRAYLDYAVHKEIKFSDLTADVFRIPIDKDRWLLSVRARVKTAFTGGTPTVTIGDSDSAHGYTDTADLDITTINKSIDSKSAGEAYAVGGRFYAAANQLVVTFATGSTAGVLVLEMIFSGYSAPQSDMISNQ